jgi:hypothetical protein
MNTQTATIDKKKRFNFKEYYANNPEFRDRHLLKEKVRCGCGKQVFLGLWGNIH